MRSGFVAEAAENRRLAQRDGREVFRDVFGDEKLAGHGVE
jgi:hypothetical protein